MLLSWLNRQGLTTAAIPEIYAWGAAIAVSMLVLYGVVWLALISTPYCPKLPRLAVPVIAAWAYLLGVALPLWLQSTHRGCLVELDQVLYNIPALLLLMLLRSHYALHFSWGRSVCLGVITLFACLMACISIYVVNGLLS
jgi:hypothetical protein